LFVDTLFLNDMFFARTIRSPLQSGRLFSMDCPALPEGYRLICARDIPGLNRLAGAGGGFDPAFSHPVFAENELLYEGQPVALLAGPERDELDRLAAALLLNVGEAALPQRVYAGRDVVIEMNAKAGRAVPPGKEGAPPAGGQFRRVETFHKTPCARHNAPECTVAAAFFEGPRCVIHVATRWPAHVQKSVAGALGIPESSVVVRCGPAGVSFDAKVWYPSLIAVQAALAAFITGRPVKLALSREEERRYSPRRASSEIRIASTLDERGRIVETDIAVKADLGACGFFADEIIDRMAVASLGVYRLGTVTIKAQAVGSASVPGGAFCGFGLAQGFFAIERHVAHIARELCVSPFDWLLENGVLKPGYGLLKAGAGAPRKTQSLHAVVETVSDQSGFGRKWAAYDLLRQKVSPAGDSFSPVRGIGLAAAYQGSGLLYHMGGAPLPAVTALIEGGKLTVKCASVADKEEKAAWLQSIVLSAADLAEPARWEIGGGWGDDPAALSNDAVYVSALVEEAAQSAALLPDAPVKQSETRYHSEDAATWAGKTGDVKAFAHPALCAAVVEIEIDKTECRPVIRGIWLCVDGGKIFSIQDAANTLVITGIAALAWAQGKQNIPDMQDIPRIHIDFIPSESDYACGLEELAFSTIPAAYASAVSQALNVSFDSIPIRQADVWQAMRERGSDDKGGAE
jgi:CO/xanthine dehydrogenase Mo-binding subunit